MDANFGFPLQGPQPEHVNPALPKKPEADKSKSAFQRANPGQQKPAQTHIQVGRRGGASTSKVTQTAGSQLGIATPKISPQMKARLQEVEQYLKKSEEAESLDERLLHMPQIPRAKGIAGSYFVGPSDSPILLIKPHIQEAGAEKVKEVLAYPGVKPGTGAIRERMAYTLQDALGFSCGIPETTCHAFRHEMFGPNSENTKNLQILRELSGIGLTRELVAKHYRASPDGTFSTALENILKEKLEKLIPDPKLRQKFFDLAKASLSLSELRAQIISKDIAKVCFSISHIVENKEKIEAAAMSIYTNLNAPRLAQKEELASAQTVENGCISLDELAYDEEHNELHLIPQLEVEKFLIDCILFNMDRHLGNALVRKLKVTDIDAKLAGVSDHEKERLLGVKQHALRNNSEYAYELILIDHGTILPEQNFTEAMAKFEWRSLDQVDAPLTETTKNRILNLDPAILLAKVKEDQKVFEAKFGKPCEVSEDAFSFMQFSCAVLQEAVRQNKSMFALAELYEGFGQNGLLEVYLREVHGKTPNWTNIQNKISNIIGSSNDHTASE